MLQHKRLALQYYSLKRAENLANVLTIRLWFQGERKTRALTVRAYPG